MKRLYLIPLLCLTLSGAAMAAQTTILNEGAFDSTIRTQINNNFTDLYSGGMSSFTSAITASTALTGNPLQQNSVGVLTAAQINAGTDILASASNKTVYPGGGFTLMASGSAAGSTGVYLRCRGSNNVIASFPIAMLTDGIPAGPFKSSGTGTGSPVLASALTRGCAASDGIYISVTGSALTTTTHLYYSLPYIVQ